MITVEQIDKILSAFGYRSLYISYDYDLYYVTRYVFEGEEYDARQHEYVGNGILKCHIWDVEHRMHDCYEFNYRKKDIDITNDQKIIDALYKYIKKILRERIKNKKAKEIEDYITSLVEIEMEKEIQNAIKEIKHE